VVRLARRFTGTTIDTVSFFWNVLGKTVVAHGQKSSPRCSGYKSGTRIGILASCAGRMGYQRPRFQVREVWDRPSLRKVTALAETTIMHHQCQLLSTVLPGYTYIDIIRYYPMHAYITAAMRLLLHYLLASHTKLVCFLSRMDPASGTLVRLTRDNA